MILRRTESSFLICVFQIVLVAVLISGCIPGLNVPSQAQSVTQTQTQPNTQTPTLSPTITPTPTVTPPPLAETTFDVEVPALTPADEKISLDVLDEVTGLSLNILRYSMDRLDETHYSIRIPVTLGSIIRYRYVRESNPVSIEYNSQGNQVRYRLYYVNTPGIVKDTISGWTDLPYNGGVGRIQGQVTDATTNLPIPNVMVTAGGIQTITSSDGSFILEGLSPGTHNLVAYSIDGSYQPYAQGAMVAIDSTTPAPLQLTPTKKVKISFIVHLPKGSATGIPLRMVGNIYPLGNTFADLQGGISTIADRAPTMESLPDGTYSLMVELPAGLDLRYKYSLGDGFWNAELTNDNQFRVRQLIVPDADLTIDDTIDSWGSENFGPITFNVKVPENTPSTDLVSIQFNSFSWTEPIPMWPLGNNQWTFTLSSPV
ncbi:MAG: carboxypeptidase-like regulatory domain-containing protein [Anaerolineaceae bacterium]